jgi:hypothetical protein
MYSSRRIKSQHRKRVWTGRGRSTSRIKYVNIGVQKIRKVKMRAPKSSKIKTSSGLKQIHVSRAPGKRLRYSPKYLSYSADPINQETPDEFVEAMAGFAPDDEQAMNKYRQFIKDKAKMDARIDRIQGEIGDAARQQKLAKTVNQKRQATVMLADLNADILKQEHVFNKSVIDEQQRQIGRAINRIAEEDETVAKQLEKEQMKNNLTKARIQTQMNEMIREMQKADTEAELRASRKNAQMVWEQYDSFKKKQEDLQRRINPYGFNMKIAPIIMGGGFGKMKFARMGF